MFPRLVRVASGGGGVCEWCGKARREGDGLDSEKDGFNRHNIFIIIYIYIYFNGILMDTNPCQWDINGIFMGFSMGC